MQIKPPWQFCTGWWSPWCVIDITAHKLGLPLQGDYWICNKHDASLEAYLTKRIIMTSPILWGPWRYNYWTMCWERFGYSTSTNYIAA